MFLFATVEHTNSIFGLFENNLLNWLGLVAIIVWLMARFLPSAFKEHKSTIASALKEAHEARIEGLSFLKSQEEKIASAEREAELIIIEAKKIAEKMKLEIEEQTRQDITDFSHKIEQQIANERKLAITQLRAQAAQVAINLTRANLPQHLSAAVDDRLLNQFIDQVKAQAK